MKLPEAQVWSLCDQFQTALKPWAEAGFTVCSVDIEPTRGPYPSVQASIHDIEALPGARFVLSWPPCTNLTVSGARWWASKGECALEDALKNVEACKRLIGSTPGIVENPKGRLSTHWRKPDLYVHPWQFSGYAEGQSYTKETGLWLLNGARAPIPAYSAEPIDRLRIVNMNAKKRSSGAGIQTPLGMSIGIYLANKHLVSQG